MSTCIERNRQSFHFAADCGAHFASWLPMAGAVSVSPQLSSNHRRYCHLRHKPPPILVTLSALTKQGHRFLTSLATTAATDNPSVSSRLIRKFVRSSTKSVALNALAHLLSADTPHPHLSSLALPLYSRISETSWFNWNPKIVADLVALLDKQGQADKAQFLISEAVSKLELRERDLALFYCNLIDSLSKHKSKPGFLDTYARLKQLMCTSSSVYVKRRACESMVGGLCLMDLPLEAENLMEEMRGLALKPSVFEFRSVIYAYGRLGLFNDLKRCVAAMETVGFNLDTVCSNMVLSSFGAHSELSGMLSWLQNMNTSGVGFSIRTYNSVLNSCPTFMAMLQNLESLPLSIQELMESLLGDEALLLQELLIGSSSVLEAAMEWNSLEGKLDLHGMHLSSAYLIMLQWIEDLRSRFQDGNHVIPVEVTVICGSGKHSIVRGESPVKGLVKRMMVRMNCPMRIDRHNVGCFVGKGRVLKDWLG